MSNFMKIRPVGAELFHADRRTERQADMTKLKVAFRNFANATKNNRNNSGVKYSVLYFWTPDAEDEGSTSFRKVRRLATYRQELTPQKNRNFINTAVSTYYPATTVLPSLGLRLTTYRQIKSPVFLTHVFRKI
jgi:hypothetical protein